MCMACALHVQELDLDALRRETHARLFGGGGGGGGGGGKKAKDELGDMSTSGISMLEERLKGNSPKKRVLVGGPALEAEED